MGHVSPPTRASLLLRLRDGTSPEAWHEFVKLYSPLIYGFARNRGLQDADSADLMQDVLRSVSGAVGRLDYDRQKGGFRAWLFTVTRNKLFSFQERRRSQAIASGDTAAVEQLNNAPDRANHLEAEWDREYERRLAAAAMEKIRVEFNEKTWQAFWLTAVDGLSAEDVKERLGMSTGSIYVAKSRVLARVKQEVEHMMSDEP